MPSACLVTTWAGEHHLIVPLPSHVGHWVLLSQQLSIQCMPGPIDVRCAAPHGRNAHGPAQGGNKTGMGIQPRLGGSKSDLVAVLDGVHAPQQGLEGRLAHPPPVHHPRGQSVNHPQQHMPISEAVKQPRPEPEHQQASSQTKSSCIYCICACGPLSVN